MQASLLNFKTITITYFAKKKIKNQKGVPQTPPISKIELFSKHFQVRI